MIPIDKNKLYSIDEAIKLIKENKKAKFDESVEIHLKLGIDTTKGDQQVRSTAVLPHGIGKVKKIAVIAPDAKHKEAKTAGADLLGGEDLIDKIKQTEKIDFDILVSTPEMMKSLARIAKILGPKGLMPSPKNETVTTNIVKTVTELKKGKVAFKNDDTGNLHQVIGKVSFEENKLVENFKALIDEVKKAKPASSKGTYIKNAVICSTMGKGVRVLI